MNYECIAAKYLFPFQSIDSVAKKVVFIIRGQITSVKKDVLRDILRSGNVQNVVLYTDLPPEMHTIYEFGDNTEDRSVFLFYKEIMYSWMGNEVSFVHFIVSISIP